MLRLFCAAVCVIAILVNTDLGLEPDLNACEGVTFAARLVALRPIQGQAHIAPRIIFFKMFSQLHVFS